MRGILRSVDDDAQDAEQATVTDIAERPKRTFGGLDPAEAGRRGVEARRQKALERKQQTEEEKALASELRVHLKRLSKVDLFKKYMQQMADDTPLADYAEATARYLMGGILAGDIEVKGSNVANVLDSVFKIVQLTQGKPTSIDGSTYTPEERREALAEFKRKIAERSAERTA